MDKKRRIKWNWIHELKTSTISRRLILNFLMMLFIATAILMAINFVSVSVLKNRVIESRSNELKLLSGQLEVILDKYDVVNGALISDTDINAYNQAKEEEPFLWHYKDVLVNLQYSSILPQLDGEISLFMMNKGRIFSSANSISKNADIIDFLGEHEKINYGQWHFFSKQQDGVRHLYKINKNSYSQPETGLIVFSKIYNQSLISLLKSYASNDGDTVFLMDKYDQYIYTGQEDLDWNEITQEILSVNLASDTETIKINDSNLRLIFYNYEKTGLILGALVDDQYLLREINFFRIIILLSIIPIVLVAIFFSRITHRDIIHPIHEIIEGMHKVQNSDFSVQLERQGNDEFSYLYNQFNSMTQQLDMLIREVYLQNINFQQAQLKLLQSQINPHFLYNCLNFIYQMSMRDENKTTADMTLYLGRYFRYATRIDKDMTPLHEELYNIEAYIKIQQLRFPDMIDYKNNLSEKIMNIMLPRLIVQPIVENAVIHAIERCGMPGSIWISGRIDDDFLYITVEDNGPGVTSEKLRILNEKLTQISSEGSGYGLVNTHWRLKLRYGEKSGVKIEHRKLSGLKVTLIIQISKEE